MRTLDIYLQKTMILVNAKNPETYIGIARQHGNSITNSITEIIVSRFRTSTTMMQRPPFNLITRYLLFKRLNLGLKPLSAIICCFSQALDHFQFHLNWHFQFALVDQLQLFILHSLQLLLTTKVARSCSHTVNLILSQRDDSFLRSD